jgi:hypothetical protein
MSDISCRATYLKQLFHMVAVSTLVLTVIGISRVATAECHSADPHGCDSKPATAADLPKYPWLSDTTLVVQLKSHSPEIAQVIALEQKDLVRNGLGPRLDFRHGSLKSPRPDDSGYVEWWLELTRNGMAYRIESGSRKELLVLGREHWDLFAGGEGTELRPVAEGRIGISPRN